MTNRNKHSLDVMKKNFNKTIDNVIKVLLEPKSVPLKLPKLKKKIENKAPLKSNSKLKKVT